MLDFIVANPFFVIWSGLVGLMIVATKDDDISSAFVLIWVISVMLMKWTGS